MDCECTGTEMRPMIAMPPRPQHDGGARTEEIRRPPPSSRSPSGRPARRRRSRGILPYVVLLILGVSRIASAKSECGERSLRSTTKDGSVAESHAEQFSKRHLQQVSSKRDRIDAIAAPAKGAESTSISNEIDRLLRRGAAKQRGTNEREPRRGRGSKNNNRGRKKQRGSNNNKGRNKKRGGGNNSPAATNRKQQKGRAANQAKRKRNTAKRAKQQSRTNVSNGRGNKKQTTAAKKNKTRSKGGYNGDTGGKNYKKKASSGRGSTNYSTNKKAAGDGSSSATVQKTVMKKLHGYYPISGEGKCVKDNSYPDYMGADREYYFAPVLNQCCRRHFRGSAPECVAESSKPTRKVPTGGGWGWGGGSWSGGQGRGSGSSTSGEAWRKPAGAWQPPVADKHPPCDPWLPGFPQRGCDIIIEIESPPTIATYEPTHIPTGECALRGFALKKGLLAPH